MLRNCTIFLINRPSAPQKEDVRLNFWLYFRRRRKTFGVFFFCDFFDNFMLNFFVTFLFGGTKFKLMTVFSV